MSMFRRSNQEIWSRPKGSFIKSLLNVSRTISKKIFAQFEVAKVEWHHFENAKKRDFRISSHFEMAVSPKIRNQIYFSNRHLKVFEKPSKARSQNVFSFKF